MLNPKYVLITGGAGLLGSNLIRYILQNTNDYQIIVVDNLSGGYYDFIPNNRRVKFFDFDLGNQDAIEELFISYNITYVFHLAAYAAEGLSPFIRCYNYRENICNSAMLINMSINYNIKKFIFTSSMAVYGQQNPPFHEDQIPQPMDPYGIAKYAVEMDLRVAKEQHGLDYCIIRPHNVYGPYQNVWDRYRNVLGIWMVKIKKGEAITIYGDGEQVRSFSFIDDFTPALWNSAIFRESSGEIINLGSEHYHTINQAAEIMKRVVARTGHNFEINYLEPRHEAKKAYCTHQKSVEVLDFKELHNLEKGLEIMWDWFLQEPDRKIKSWPQYELHDGVYSYWK